MAEITDHMQPANGMRGAAVSVVIPTYGARGALRQSVESALCQSLSPREVIVVDDNAPGSEARAITEKVMAEYAGDERVRYIRHPENRNGAAARNTGIRAASGNYIAFLDDDDAFLPEKLKTQTAFLESHPEFDAAYCLARRNGRDLHCVAYEGDASLPMLLGATSMYTPSLLFRRSALESIGGFDEKFRRHQDFELLLHFFDSGFRIGCVREVLLELGSNQGENIPHGDALEKLKELFLSQFADVIGRLDREKPGTRRRILAHHYSLVFIDHVKMRHFRRAARIFMKYFPKHPAAFMRNIYITARIHLLRALPGRH